MPFKVAFFAFWLVAVCAQQSAAAPSSPTKAPTNAPAVVGGSKEHRQLFCSAKSSLALRQTDLRWNVKLDPQTRWQPRGGTVRITVARGKGNTEDFAPYEACFGWLRPDGSVIVFDRDAVVRVVQSSDPTLVQLQVTVPELSFDNGNALSRLFGEHNAYQGLGIVPVAALRLIGGASGNIDFVAAVPIGVTSTVFSLFASTASILLALIVFGMWVKGVQLTKPLGILRLVAGKEGYASLSQFQILIWTVVIALSAEYVMMLSGNLIAVSNGALILLGVSGASAVGAKLQGNRASNQAMTAQVTAASSAAKATMLQAGANALPATTLDEVKAKAEVVAQAAASSVTAAAAAGSVPAAVAPGVVREPQWVDLVRTQDGTGAIDMSRLQMLLFTLIAASFVALQVFTTYVIPDIPESFLWLMGISNGVYITNKVAS
jgi:hypothetical protein